MDFISGLPISQGNNTIYTCIGKFTKFVRLIPCFKGEGALSALECANLLFSKIIRFWYSENNIVWSWFKVYF